VKHLFAKYDKDMSGSLDKDELRALSECSGGCCCPVLLLALQRSPLLPAPPPFQ
jgi:hypothetical protein